MLKFAPDFDVSDPLVNTSLPPEKEGCEQPVTTLFLQPFNGFASLPIFYATLGIAQCRRCKLSCRFHKVEKLRPVVIAQLVL